MKKTLWIGITAVVLAGIGILIYYYSGGSDSAVPETESEVLNELLSAAPLSRIELNIDSGDTLLASKIQMTLPSRRSDEMLDSFRSTQIKVFGDYLVAMDFLTDNIAVFRKSGGFVRYLNRNELSQAASLMSDGESLFVYDYGNKQLHRYNGDLSFEESVSFSAPYYAQGSVSANRNHLVLQNEAATGFRVGETQDSLLAVMDINQPDQTLFKALPRIVPSGKHPGGFNNLIFSINERSEIAAAYPALPYLFLYRNFEHVQTVVLQAADFETVDNPPLTPFQPVAGEAVQIQNLIDEVLLTESGNILMFGAGRLHHLKPRRNGDIVHHKSYNVVPEDGDPLESVSSLDADPDNPDIVYATSDGRIYRFEIL
ncbi:MAG: hypothetical protein R6V27_07760 [Balneolaceae bacterium]